MRSLRIKGLVSIANSIRRELARPISTSRKEELRNLAILSLRQVDQIAANHGTTPRALSPPSRRAYSFLAGLDFAKLPSQETAPQHPPSRGNVALAGLRAFLDRMCVLLAAPLSAERAGQLHESIHSTSENVEQFVRDNDLTGPDLTEQTRSLRGWLALLADRQSFDAYVSAVARARPAFERAIDRNTRFINPATVEFRPTRGLYRIRGDGSGTRVVLATPMICFTDENFSSVAGAAIRNGSKQAMVQAASGEAYQGIQAELEALGGVDDLTAGVHRDLDASFRRVVAAYFGGDMPRPRMAWSHAFTGRKFGHYDPIGDAVMISCTLDRADVPEFVLDSVMHHELLHKRLGVRWHDGRMNAHSPEFRREERRFAKYEEADHILKRLAGES